MKNFLKNSLLVCICFCFMPVTYALDIEVRNGSTGHVLAYQSVTLRIYEEDMLKVDRTFLTNRAGEFSITPPASSTINNIELRTEYKGYPFYYRGRLSDKVLLEVFDPAYDPEDIRIRQLNYNIVRGDGCLIFEVSIEYFNQGINYFVSGNYFYQLPEKARVISAAPRVFLDNNRLTWKDGLRPSANIFVFSYLVPYDYRSPYMLEIPAPFFVDNLLVVGDRGLDLETGISVDKKIKKSGDIFIAYFTVQNIRDHVLVKIIPEKKRSFYWLELMAGIFISMLVLLYIRWRTLPVQSFGNLLQNIRNRNIFDRELL